MTQLTEALSYQKRLLRIELPGTGVIFMALPDHIHLPEWVKYVAVGLVSVVGLAWLYWISSAVWELSTNHMPTINSSLSKMEEQLTDITGRIERISNRLPTEIARNSQETLEKQIQTAIIVGQPYQVEGIWTRDVMIVDGPNGAFKKVKMAVSAPEDQAPIDRLFGSLRIKAPGSELSFAAIETDAKKYGVELDPMPSFVDKSNSALLNLDFNDASAIVSNSVAARGIPKTVAISPPGELTYKTLAKRLTENEGKF